MSERKCLECGDTLRGRADQKFCSDQCRNTYNNRQLGESNHTIRHINRILKKNHTILTVHNQSGKTTVSKTDLLKSGFNFGYFTNTFQTRSGRTYFFCYDQGYSLLDHDKIILVRKQDYV